jgi:prevent-host-death family protein
VCKIMPMQTITVPIGAGRSDLCGLIDRVQSGVQVIFTSHGEPKAVLRAYRAKGKPWRRKADPKLFGDLQSPVMEDWS